MIDKTSKIFLTYKIGGEYLAKAGLYQNAKLSVEKNEKYKTGEGEIILIQSIDTPMRIVSQPVYIHARKNITLGWVFIEHALKRPEQPHKRASLKEWELYHRWNKLSKVEKLKAACTKYVDDLGGYDVEIEIL